LQPAGLVPAAIFALLNLAFLYPAAARDKVGVALLFAGLDGTWQAIVVATVILSVGYLLLNAANSIIETMTGQSWRGSPLHAALRNWQLRRRTRLEAADEESNRTAHRFMMATRFPPVANYVQPTRFGNAIAASQHLILGRYGIELAALWSPMEATEKIKDAPALKVAKDEKATLDLLANLIFVLVLFALEGLIYYSARGRFSSALLASLTIPLAYVAYRVAVTRARAWGDALAVVYDLHRGELQKALGLRASKGLADERKMWSAASHFYLAGGERTPAPDLYEAPPTAKPTVTAAPSLKVDLVSTAVVPPTEHPGYRWYLQAFSYLFVVSRPAEQKVFADADFIVEDRRVGAIEAVPAKLEDDHLIAEAEKVKDSTGVRLIWHVRGLNPGRSFVLAYELPTWILEAPAGAEVIDHGKNGFEIRLSGNVGDEIRIALVSLGPKGKRPKLRAGDDRLRLRLSDRTFAVQYKVAADEPSLFLELPKGGGS